MGGRKFLILAGRTDSWAASDSLSYWAGSQASGWEKGFQMKHRIPTDDLNFRETMNIGVFIFRKCKYVPNSVWGILRLNKYLLFICNSNISGLSAFLLATSSNLLWEGQGHSLRPVLPLRKRKPWGKEENRWACSSEPKVAWTAGHQPLCFTGQPLGPAEQVQTLSACQLWNPGMFLPLL